MKQELKLDVVDVSGSGSVNGIPTLYVHSNEPFTSKMVELIGKRSGVDFVHAGRYRLQIEVGKMFDLEVVRKDITAFCQKLLDQAAER